ncbi:hypothetical protein [Nocardia brasiliensis]|uniref:hypothetical protein n=1 Tax=Nocardia brasiliensis TaxID=37326 RepID=UPI0009DE234F|nr:hypothetical protein [Nocardia brasiliensis]MBF6127327.1 hypothetical protein [Nocardia brasiliensis]MBF6547362.1 hypothetical protein [Nocardia brasiliensis]
MRNEKSGAAAEPASAPSRERADLVAWRRRDALRRSNAAQPLPNKRRYRRVTKHRKAVAE